MKMNQKQKMIIKKENKELKKEELSNKYENEIKKEGIEISKQKKKI